MYSHCLFCHAHLGANEVIEALPIGRRVAFDAAKGRLWVVCVACGQWNLTPLEERWEAVEAAERLFADARRRVSGEQVGLAKLGEGLKLVRVGKPQRPEFAAWRYGDQFGRRRRRAYMVAGGVAVAGGAVLAAGPLLGIGMSTVVTLAQVLNGVRMRRGEKPIFLPRDDGSQLVLTPGAARTATLVARPDALGGWGIDVSYYHILPPGRRWKGRIVEIDTEFAGTARLAGRDATHATERLMSKSAGNAIGMRQKHIEQAVGFIEQAGGPDAWFRLAAKQVRKWAPDQMAGQTGAINYLPLPVRLALEMAAHEDAERRALDGELAALEARWREAEEVAAIADDLLLPASVRRGLKRLRG